MVAVAQVPDEDWQDLIVPAEHDILLGPPELPTTVTAANATEIVSLDMIDILPVGQILKDALAHTKRQAVRQCKTDPTPDDFLPIIAFLAQAGTRYLARYLLALIPAHGTLSLTWDSAEALLAAASKEDGLDARYCDVPGVYKILRKVDGEPGWGSYTGQINDGTLRERMKEHEEKFRQSRAGKAMTPIDAVLHDPKTTSILYITVAPMVPRGVDRDQAPYDLSRLWKRATGKDWRLGHDAIVQYTCAVLELAVLLHYGDFPGAVP